MISNAWKNWYWKRNAESMMGFGPGELTCVGYHIGGGFAGAAEVLVMAKTSGIAPGTTPPGDAVEFPLPSVSVEYRIGGHLFDGYHYHRSDAT